MWKRTRSSVQSRGIREIRDAVVSGSITVTQRTDHDHIRENLIPEVLQHMRQGEAHYGSDNHQELGLPGQYADMWRKIKPLKRALWDGDTKGMKESPREICFDLIGHCLLTIAMIDRTQPSMRDRSAEATEVVLKAAGWTEDTSGHLVPPPDRTITIPGSRGRTEQQLRADGWYEENGVWHSPPTSVWHSPPPGHAS